MATLLPISKHTLIATLVEDPHFIAFLVIGDLPLAWG